MCWSGEQAAGAHTDVGKESVGYTHDVVAGPTTGARDRASLWWGMERSSGWWGKVSVSAPMGETADREGDTNNEDGKRRTGKRREGVKEGGGGKNGEERERERCRESTTREGREREREDRTRNGVTVTYIMRAPVRAHALSLETPRHSLLRSGALTASARSHRRAPTTPRIRSSFTFPGHRYDARSSRSETMTMTTRER